MCKVLFLWLNYSDNKIHSLFITLDQTETTRILWALKNKSVSCLVKIKVMEKLITLSFFIVFISVAIIYLSKFQNYQKSGKQYMYCSILCLTLYKNWFWSYIEWSLMLGFECRILPWCGIWKLWICTRCDLSKGVLVPSRYQMCEVALLQPTGQNICFQFLPLSPRISLLSHG